MFEGPYAGFKSVIDFRSSRPPLAALGFYAFHVAACVVISSILSGILGLILTAGGMSYHQDAFMSTTIRTAQLGSDAYATILYALIIHTRATWKKPLSLLGLVLTFVLAMFGGAMLGVIPAAVTLGLPSSISKKRS